MSETPISDQVPSEEAPESAAQSQAPPAAAAAPRSASYRTTPTYSTVVADDPRRKSPLLASFLSAMPGLGQVYVGYYQRGFAHLLTVAGTIAVLNTRSLHNNEALVPAVAFFLVFFWLYNIIDAGRRASFYNYALAGGTDINLPQDLGAPMSGSIAGGVVAIAVGALLLSHTLLDFSMDWLEEWWPMAIIGFGVFLVYRARQDQAKNSTAAHDLEGY